MNVLRIVETGVKLYFDEILALVVQGLESQIWVSVSSATNSAHT